MNALSALPAILCLMALGPLAVLLLLAPYFLWRIYQDVERIRIAAEKIQKERQVGR